MNLVNREDDEKALLEMFISTLCKERPVMKCFFCLPLFFLSNDNLISLNTDLCSLDLTYALKHYILLHFRGEFGIVMYYYFGEVVD